MAQDPVQSTPHPSPTSRPLFTVRRKFLITGMVVALALGYFVFNVFQGAAVYYLTVGELLERGTGDRIVRVNGSLVEGSFTRESGGTLAHFHITDGIRELPSTYDGAVPVLFFNEHSQVVLEGQYGRDGVFRAETVLVKCPTKYEALALEEST